MASYRFGPFRVNPAQRHLEREGQPVHLAVKTFDLLLTLLRHRDRALSKDELLASLWPDAIVEDGNLAQQIFLLRRALGETGECVRTVAGYGYRFCGDVFEDGAPAPPPLNRIHTLHWNDREFFLREGVSVVGRAQDADIQIPLASLSRRHARVTVRGREATVEDLGSRNGTWLRGRTLDAPVTLVSGDELHFGSAAVMYRFVLASDSTQPLRLVPRQG